jgi:hypothetical protein
MATKQATIYVHDGVQWVRARTVHPLGALDAGYQEPWEVFVSDGTDWYGCWPEESLARPPGVTNLRGVSITSTSFGIQWNAITGNPLVTHYAYNCLDGPAINQRVIATTSPISQAFTGLTPNTTYTAQAWTVGPNGSTPTNIDVTTLP